MKKNEDAVTALMKQAGSIYAGLVFVGCIDGWENIDAVFRSGDAPRQKIEALRYEFCRQLYHPNVTERLRERILIFSQTSA